MKLLLASLLCLMTSCGFIAESAMVMHAWGEFIGESVEKSLKECVASRPE